MAVFSSPSSFPSPICALDVDRLDGSRALRGGLPGVYQVCGVVSKQDMNGQETKEGKQVKRRMSLRMSGIVSVHCCWISFAMASNH